MAESALDKFGMLLIRKVRDEAISDWKKMIHGQMKGASAEQVREILRPLSAEDKEIVTQIIPGIVDTVLHHLLWTVEQNADLQLGIRTDQGIESLREISDGLPGELYSDEGWIARFSKESPRFL